MRAPGVHPRCLKTLTTDLSGGLDLAGSGRSLELRFAANRETKKKRSWPRFPHRFLSCTLLLGREPYLRVIGPSRPPKSHRRSRRIPGVTGHLYALPVNAISIRLADVSAFEES